MNDIGLLERIQFIMSELGFKSKGEFADAIDVGRSNLSQMLQNKRTVGDAILNKISIHLNINKDWLLTGEGEMLKSRNVEVIKSNAEIRYIPIVSQYAYAGYLVGFADSEYLETLPTMPLIVTEATRTGNLVGFELKGDSMDDGSQDSLLDGDLLACKEITCDLWKLGLNYKRLDFVIVHKTEGILAKKIINQDLENGTITIHSLNPLYPDRILQLNDIAQIFSIEQVTRRRR